MTDESTPPERHADHQPTTPTTPQVPPPAGEQPPLAAPAPPARPALPKRLLAGVVAAVVVAFGGGYAVSAVQGDSAASADTRDGFPGRSGTGPDGTDGQMGPMGGPMGGPVAGEEHVTGTITSVGSDTVTVKASDGSTATYSVTSDTQILDDGAVVALSDLAQGTDVLVHVIPADSGDGTAERILAGSSAQDFGGMPRAPGSDDGTGSDDGSSSGTDSGSTSSQDTTRTT